MKVRIVIKVNIKVRMMIRVNIKVRIMIRVYLALILNCDTAKDPP